MTDYDYACVTYSPALLFALTKFLVLFSAFLAFSVYDTDRQNDLNADEADEISRDISGSDSFA